MAQEKLRRPLSKKLRFEVFKRDGFRCQYCGATPDQALLQCDHIHPVALGGKNEIDNLVTSCQPCNIGKGARSLEATPTKLEDRAIETHEREEQIAAYQAIMRSRRSRIEEDAEDVVNLFCDLYQAESIPRQDFISIKLFVEKLGVAEVLNSAERAYVKQARHYNYGFKYFCGICWGKIRDRGAQ